MSNPSTSAFEEQTVRSNILTNETSLYFDPGDSTQNKKNTYITRTVAGRSRQALHLDSDDGDPTELEDRSCQMTGGLTPG